MRPPQTSLGRPLNEIITTYLQESRKSLSVQYRPSENVYVSVIEHLSLPEYVAARAEHCRNTHEEPCCKCQGLLKVGSNVLQNSYCVLSDAFRTAFPHTKYTAERARRALLQIPLVAVRIGNPCEGNAYTILMEKYQGVDYTKISRVLEALASTSKKPDVNLSKSCAKMLLALASSDREREVLRYTICKASGVSQSEARRKFGFESMSERINKVDHVLEEMERIREAVDDLAQAQDKAMLESIGITVAISSSEEESEESDTQDCQEASDHVTCDVLKTSLESGNFNWFECIHQLESDFSDEAVCKLTETFPEQLPALNLGKEQENLALTSYRAFLADKCDAYEQERLARTVNGEVVTDSESDNPDDFVGLTSILDEAGKQLISKRRATIKRRAQRTKAKAVAKRRFLSKKLSKKVSRIMQNCPDIGKTIESFVQERKVGADAWRRTGVLTFDGNTRLKEKVTYERVRQHLQHVYNRTFSYGSVVQLCVARNKRRLSAKRYKGVAMVTSRRARKGFCIRYNPDAHWSSAFYKGLNSVQYQDGRDIFNVNRDDASGFRLDTLATNKQHATPVVQNHEVLTTRTDYVNKYPSTLQVTSYNFSETATTPEVCVGVVKAPIGIHHKNPCQHAMDLKMLEEKEQLKPVFYNLEAGREKRIDCVRVDGASDEGPSHEEVQFYWTEGHIEKRKVATLITARNSGASYLNRVELQNGCLALGHSNTFIPSTLGGSCTDSITGNVDAEKLKSNMNLAIEAYISRVDGCPCGGTSIQLFRGPEASEQQAVRSKLLTFLKGSKKQRLKLSETEPRLFEHFQKVWQVRNDHMVHELPTQYIFFLICCYKTGCHHPCCVTGQPAEPVTWYPGGPPISHLPLPIIDGDRPWGNSCSSCSASKFCSGHYKLQLVDVKNSTVLKQLPKPPSTTLKERFASVNIHQQPSALQQIAQEVLLSQDECQIWLEHLQNIAQNRRRGAQRAAETRRLRKVQMNSRTLTTTPLATRPTSGTTTTTYSATPGTTANLKHCNWDLNLSLGTTTRASETELLSGTTTTASETELLSGTTTTASETELFSGTTTTASETELLSGTTTTASETELLSGTTTTASETDPISGATSTSSDSRKSTSMSGI